MLAAALAARLAHGDVADITQHISALAIAQPAEFGQKDASIGLVESDLFRIGIPETGAAPFALERWEVGALGEEILVRLLEVFQGLLQRVTGCLCQPWCLRPIAPPGQQLGHGHVVDELQAGQVILFLQRQGFVVDEPASPGEAAHVALLLAIRHQFEPECLETLHA